MRSGVVLSLFLLSFMAFGQEKDTVRYSLLFGDTKAGFMKKWKNTDGSFTEWFQYNDRGRGDSTVTRYHLDDTGEIVWMEGRGVDYFKKPTYEKFRLENDTAYWENTTEKDSAFTPEKGTYIPLSVGAGTSMKAYFLSPDSTISLIPSGRSKLEVLYHHTLDNGEVIRLISTRGAGLAPSFMWIDEEDEFFGFTGSWMSFLPIGHESLREELDEIEKKYSKGYFKRVSERVTQNIGQGLVISNLRVFDPATGDLTPNTTIVMNQGRILEVTQGDFTVPEGYQSMDGQGRFAMPGLWDMHVHYGDGLPGLLHLANGVTSVRDMGNGTDLVQIKDQIDAGELLGPRIQAMSGFIDRAGEYAGPTGEKIESLEEGIEAIRMYSDLGYQQIKLYSSIKPEWVEPLAAEAHKYGMRVSGHIPSFMLASEAVEAGYDEIQHMNMLLLNFLGKEIDTRTPARFNEVGKQAASIDFDSQEFKDFIALLKAEDVTIDPTVTIFEGMLTGEAGKPDPSYERIVHRLPINTQRGFKTGSALDIPAGMEDTYRASYEKMLKLIRILHQNGITMVAGTDAFAGFTLHRELENYVKAGIPSAEVLKIATLTAATIANKSEDYGTLEKGKVSDLILIEGNPLENIQDLTRISLVIKGDLMYETRELLEAVSIAYFQ
ncbi:MAG: amidohydrolase family protein [Cytophagales bacterium]|nr:amidohydrolase family protein [Cytophagales bacterium]